MADVFRKQYRELSADEKAALDEIKTKGEELHGLIGLVKGTAFNSREAALAKTKLEECIMWAVKAITG